MKIFIGLADHDWFEHLRHIPELTECNYWQPNPNNAFKALQPGELFLFKAHKAQGNAIIGGGWYTHFSILPTSLAWDAFGESNGSDSLEHMRKRISKYRKSNDDPRVDYRIGCILLSLPFFFSREQWIPEPPDWSPNIVRGKGYDLSSQPGMQIWQQVQERLQQQPTLDMAVGENRYGMGYITQPRLGQGAFRVLVTDAYHRRCAVCGEHTLPVLEAAHIRPYSEGGKHSLSNGLLLRSDIHTLFDKGYVTVTTQNRFEVSASLREDFHNGKEYRRFHGKELLLPDNRQQWPSSEIIQWHNENLYKG